MIITIETDDFPIDARFSVDGKAFKVIADKGEFLPEEITLRNIVGIGIAKINEAVEAVIANHEGEIKLEYDAKAILKGNHRDWRIQAAAAQAAQSCEYLELKAWQAQRIQNISLSDISGLARSQSGMFELERLKWQSSASGLGGALSGGTLLWV